jgi:hypothetical protein
MSTYKLQKDPNTQEVKSILRADGWSIPFDPANVDYQQYLAWLEEGGQPLPADEVSGE